MAALVWDKEGEREYQTGVDQGVLYPWDDDWYGTGVAWNGLTSVQTTPSGGEANPFYADNIKYLNIYSLEENGATIEAYTYPDAFEECDGSKLVTGTVGLKVRSQTRKLFGVSWRTKIGTDLNEDAGYMIHLLYGCKASPSERQYQTINDSPEPITFSWEITTTSPSFPKTLTDAGLKPSSLFEIDSRDFTGQAASKLTALEEKLYGTDNTEPALPTMAELLTLLAA